MIRTAPTPHVWPFRSIQGQRLSGRMSCLILRLTPTPLGLARQEDREVASTAITAWLNGLDRPSVLWFSSRPVPPDDLTLIPADETFTDDVLMRYRGAAYSLGEATRLFRRSVHLIYPIFDQEDAGDVVANLAGPLETSGIRVKPLVEEELAAFVARVVGDCAMAGLRPQLWTDGPHAGASDVQVPTFTAPPAISDQFTRGARDWRDLVLPAAIREFPDHLELDDLSLSVLELFALPRELTTGITDDFLRAPWAADFVVGIQPLPQEQVVRYLSRRIRDLKAGTALAPNTPETDFRQPQAVADAETLRQALYLGETRLHQVWTTWVLRAPTPGEAIAIGRAAVRKAAQVMVDVRTARYRQREVWSGLLPGQVARPGRWHNLTTEGVACLLPLDAVSGEQIGPWVGVNLLDHSPLHFDRKTLPNPAGLYLGGPGSGKSTYAKCELLRQLSGGDDRAVLVDPEGEYAPLVEELGGEVLRPGAPGHSGVNPVALEGLSLAARSERLADLVGFLDPLVGPLDPSSRGHLYRALSFAASQIHGRMRHAVEYLQSTGAPPTLADALAYLLDGPLSLLDPEGPGGRSLPRIVALDLTHVDPGLLPTLAPLLTEHLQHRLQPTGTERIWVTLDEVHVFLVAPAGRRLLARLFKRARKHRLIVTGITQNITDLVRSDDGKAILAGASHLFLFRPGPGDADVLAPVVRLSQTARQALDRLSVGEALWVEGNRCIPIRTLLTRHELPLIDTRPNRQDPTPVVAGPIQ